MQNKDIKQQKLCGPTRIAGCGLMQNKDIKQLFYRVRQFVISCGLMQNKDIKQLEMEGPSPKKVVV